MSTLPTPEELAVRFYTHHSAVVAAIRADREAIAKMMESLIVVEPAVPREYNAGFNDACRVLLESLRPAK